MNLVETNARLLSALHACTGCKSGLKFKEEVINLHSSIKDLEGI